MQKNFKSPQLSLEHLRTDPCIREKELAVYPDDQRQLVSFDGGGGDEGG